MLAKRIAVTTVVAFLLIGSLAFFTDIFAHLPVGLGRPLTSDYWNSIGTDPSADAPAVSWVFLYSGVVCVPAFLFWHLWVQRIKQEEVLAVYARAADVRDWLREWALAEYVESDRELRRIVRKAKRQFRKLNRLLMLEDRENWRVWYSWYLVAFYFINAHKISAFLNTKTDPPLDEWPRPDDAIKGLDAADCDVLPIALDFSAHFADGAKASMGIRLLQHSFAGGFATVMMSIILGGVAVIASLRYVGERAAVVFSSLTCAVVVGTVVGYLWHQVTRIRRMFQIGIAKSREAAHEGHKETPQMSRVDGWSDPQIKPMPIKPSVKSRRIRWFSYGCVCLFWGTVGLIIAYTGYKEYGQTHEQGPMLYIVIGLLLPVVCTVVEVVRFHRYCNSIPNALCVDCRYVFSTEELCETGECPKCRSSRVVGAMPDEDYTPFSQYD